MRWLFGVYRLFIENHSNYLKLSLKIIFFQRFNNITYKLKLIYCMYFTNALYLHSQNLK